MKFTRFRRREFLGSLGVIALSWPLAARAQQEIRRIGFLANDPTIPIQAAGKAFLEGLLENGFVEGGNIVIERRFAQGASERSSELAAELLRLNVSLIVASGQNNVAALREATRSVPVVMVNVLDRIGMGSAGSLVPPGSNFTGLIGSVSLRVLGKRMQLLKDGFPKISRVAVLRTPSFATDQVQWDWLERAAPAFNVRLVSVPVNRPDDVEGAFAALRRERPDALFGSNNPLILIMRKQIAELAAAQRLPAIYPFAEVTESGGLMSYGGSRTDLFRRAATYAAKILKGAKPADLHVEQATKFEFVVNRATAKQLGLSLPSALLALADQVIE
jgi:putative ABC transport system substrate-binding protein